MSDKKDALVTQATSVMRHKASGAKKLAIGIAVGYSYATFGLLITAAGAGAYGLYKGWRWFKKKTDPKDPK